MISQVSCWRTLFVANEWNELQVFRKINLSIQIVLVLFLLKFINLEALALRDCSDQLFRDANDYQAQYSRLLRIGIGSAIYLAVGKSGEDSWDGSRLIEFSGLVISLQVFSN